jgi:hypothetical protein
VVLKQNRNVGEMPPSDSESESEEEAGTRRLLNTTVQLNAFSVERARAMGERGNLQRVINVLGGCA